MENNGNNTPQREMWIVYSNMETVTNSIKLSKSKNYNFDFYIEYVQLDINSIQ